MEDKINYKKSKTINVTNVSLNEKVEHADDIKLELTIKKDGVNYYGHYNLEKIRKFFNVDENKCTDLMKGCKLFDDLICNKKGQYKLYENEYGLELSYNDQTLQLLSNNMNFSSFNSSKFISKISRELKNINPPNIIEMKSEDKTLTSKLDEQNNIDSLEREICNLSPSRWKEEKCLVGDDGTCGSILFEVFTSIHNNQNYLVCFDKNNEILFYY